MSPDTTGIEALALKLIKAMLRRSTLQSEQNPQIYLSWFRTFKDTFCSPTAKAVETIIAVFQMSHGYLIKVYKHGDPPMQLTLVYKI